MHKFRYTLVRSLLVAAAIAAAGRDCIAAEVTPTGSDREDQLIALLRSEAAPAEKAITCKRLAVFGTARCVPALEPLLSDPSLSSWARIPLEAIADPAAGEALRKTLPKVDGRLLVGVINSMGVRRDAGAVEALAERLTHSDTAVACAAAIAWDASVMRQPRRSCKNLWSAQPPTSARPSPKAASFVRNDC